MRVKLVSFGETTEISDDDVVSVCPAQSEGYYYVWLRSKAMESPADSPASTPVQQLQAKIRARVDRFAKLGSWRHDSDAINVFLADLRELSAVQ